MAIRASKTGPIRPLPGVVERSKSDSRLEKLIALVVANYRARADAQVYGEVTIRMHFAGPLFLKEFRFVEEVIDR